MAIISTLPNPTSLVLPTMTYHNFIEVLNCKIQGNSSEGICYLSREREVTEREVMGVIKSTVSTWYWNTARMEQN